MSNSIKQIQKALSGLGIYQGKIDGMKGSQTIEAIRQFQSINGLLIDGICGKNTLTELFPKQIIDRIANDNIPLQRNCTNIYGKVGTNQTRITLPYPMKIAWDTSKTITRFSCHEKVHDRLANIFQRTYEAYGQDVHKLGLDMFGGCLNVRKMRGGSRYSMHSWGIAVDLDPANNRLKWDHRKARFAKADYNDFWAIVADEGAISLGRLKNYDWMHIQFARI